MKSPSRGTTRSCPVRPGKYARANISRKRCRAARAAAPAGPGARIRDASLTEGRWTCWPEAVQTIMTRLTARSKAKEPVNFDEMTKVRTRSNENGTGWQWEASEIGGQTREGETSGKKANQAVT